MTAKSRNSMPIIVQLALCSLLFILPQTTIPGLTETSENFIESDWNIEDDEEEKKEPISATQLETLEERIEELEAKKAAEERRMQAQMAETRRKRKKLIECMNEKGVILFSSESESCKACEKQRAYFEDDFSELEYVNCDEAKLICPFRNIKAYPTWYLGKYLGLKKEGVRSLPELAKLTDCAW